LNNKKKSDGFGPLMTFSEGPDSHEMYFSKTVKKILGGGEWRGGGGIYLGGNQE